MVCLISTDYHISVPVPIHVAGAVHRKSAGVSSCATEDLEADVATGDEGQQVHVSNASGAVLPKDHVRLACRCSASGGERSGSGADFHVIQSIAVHVARTTDRKADVIERDSALDLESKCRLCNSADR